MSIDKIQGCMNSYSFAASMLILCLAPPPFLFYLLSNVYFQLLLPTGDQLIHANSLAGTNCISSVQGGKKMFDLTLFSLQRSKLEFKKAPQ